MAPIKPDTDSGTDPHRAWNPQTRRYSHQPGTLAAPCQSGGVALQPGFAGPADRHPRGALQGFNDEVLDLDHVQFAREGAIDIPGEETEFLGELARKTMPTSLPRPRPGIPTGRIDSSMWGSSSIPKAKSSCSTTRCRRCFPWNTRCARTTSMTGGCRNTGVRCKRCGRLLTPTSDAWES